ncbi:DNA polymerase III subunit gamma and tau [Nocardioides bruguierae]|uniref:DNA polymerase III subunit gamma/tau n=1 Tax=Nocardioides bruguierae TaxID=2945102 RepID=A0A9X2D7J8_9ACTN|nr:DNA polymerase III subunit gamma and tau [Nocardioides bruguierae]MCM0620682.1 DNA polymerase III subunit gamma and tau [Nocardioides bruguierae]
MESPLALYRRYRPETFAEVIGQDHVTGPLRAALANNRVNHAYLFSGPRGCGKTTSARILARALNCEQGPTPEPCGQCESCRDLARGGPGSIDVIEIDAASHGGVDDARDLREKAFFAPVKSRYKVYIIDEAHMVTTQGFNALLKLVEEPPPHLRFIFATTEPEKVLGTIRSRTHHYPFRLIPPRLLSSYLTELCDLEGVGIEQAAIPLVVRAGGGSARDTLSVLDQLLGGAGPEGVTYQLATGLLGYTPDSLLDEVVDAFAAADGAAVFGVVDKVIETGQDPRRFTEDLLRRLRDLVIVAAVPDAPASGLIDVSEDAGERLVGQASRFGAADLTRAADIVAAGLTEMRGATAPRLLLELICARVLLPGADHGTDGLAARLDRVERRMSVSGQVSAPAHHAPSAPAQDRPRPVPAQSHAPEPPAESITPVLPEETRIPAAAPAPAPAPQAAAQQAPAPQTPVERQPAEETRAPAAGPAGAVAPTAPETAAPRAPQDDPWAVPDRPAPTSPPPSAAPRPSVGEPAAEPAEPAAEPAAGLSLVEVRRLWPDIVEATKQRRRVTWIHLTTNAQVVAVDAKTLTLGFANTGARASFDSGGSAEIVRQAAIDVVGMDWRIETIVDPGASPDGPVVTRPAARAPEPAAAPAAPRPAAPSESAPDASSQRGRGEPEGRARPDQRPAEQAAPAAERPPAWADDTAPPATRETDQRPGRTAAAPEESRPAWADAEPPSWADGEPTEDLPPDDGRSGRGRPEAPAPDAAGQPTARRLGSGGISAARSAIQATRSGPAAAEEPAAPTHDPDADVTMDDEDAETDDLAGAELLARELGAKVIEEIRHQ